MGVLSVLSGIFTTLFGGGSSSGTSAGGSSLASEALDKLAPETDKEKGGEEITDVDSARGMYASDLAPVPIAESGLIPFLLTWMLAAVTQLTDVANHLIRPAVVVWLIGGFSGAWRLPPASSLDAYWQSVFYLVMTFWFGGRTLVKDLPALVSAFRK